MAGLKLIRRLEELETDDDMFPEYHVGIIRELIGDAAGEEYQLIKAPS